ncbi:MAG: amino acid ABC transporter permease [Alcaligenaceae bacterium]|nr:amino acid ABC transporter permease [Alcaligenaceae bacterium]
MNAENWMIVWQARDVLLQGLGTTIGLFLGSTIAGFLLACVAVYHMTEHGGATSKLLRGGVNVMRMLPFLMFAYLLYYGLPAVGLRLTALQAGLLGLTVYHGAYIAEILRGARLTLAPGTLEAAYAHGYGRKKAWVRIVLPQLVMRSRTVLGNQAIMSLKDTSFLSIITVTELTAAANAVQSRYFIPVEAFVVAIGLYWAMGLALEAIVRRARRTTLRRGFEHV